MLEKKEKILIGVGFGVSLIFGGVSLGVSIHTSNKYKKQKEENESISKIIKDKLDMTIDEVRNASTIEIKDQVIEAAVKESADVEVAHWAHTDGQGIRTQVRGDIMVICNSAVNEIKNDIKPLVKHTMEEKAKQVSIDDIQKEVIGKTSKEVGDQLKRRMDDEVNKMIKDQNERIQTLNKVYDNINAAIGGKEEKDGK